MRSFFQRFLLSLSSKSRSRKGQTLVEYSLILVIIGIVCITAFGMLSRELVIVFSAITTLLDSAQASTF